MTHHEHSFLETLGEAFASTADKIGAAVSVGMISFHFWGDFIKPASDMAATFAPILGCFYLSLQIGFKLLDRTKGRGE